MAPPPRQRNRKEAAEATRKKPIHHHSRRPCISMQKVPKYTTIYDKKWPGDWMTGVWISTPKSTQGARNLKNVICKSNKPHGCSWDPGKRAAGGAPRAHRTRLPRPQAAPQGSRAQGRPRARHGSTGEAERACPGPGHLLSSPGSNARKKVDEL